MTVDWRVAQKPFSAEVEQASRDHAELVYPQESVGFVVDNEYVIVANIHSDPENHFKVSSDVLAEYAGRIQAVIHSHPLETHPGHPSEDDQKTQNNWNIPFGVQLINQDGAGNILWWGNGIETAHYVGRPYVFGIYDCFSIWRDYYKHELGINLKNVTRQNEWWLTGEDIYRGHAESMGFVQVGVKDIQPNDVVLTRIRSSVPNHGILYLGGDTGLHHLPYKLSSQDIISRFMDPSKEIFDSVWRYTG